MRIAVFGGAGFIGSHVVDALVERGFIVRIVDNLEPLAHPTGLPPKYLNPNAEFFKEDVRDAEGLERAIAGMEAIFYLAGAVGVGESMYRIRHYAEVNVLGGAGLLEILSRGKHTIRKIVLASSVTVYGEGKYSCRRHGMVSPSVRSEEQIAKRDWELKCPRAEGTSACLEKAIPMATDEETPAAPLSVYAATKHAQEELFLCVGRSYGIPVTVLRYFNVYGSRQAISNPYTGVAKIFASEIANGNTPVIYEDGKQTRDFIHVSDVVQANIQALLRQEANGQIFNVGTGQATTIESVARAIDEGLGARVKIEASSKHRAGDVRHCWADLKKSRALLGFEPRIFFPAALHDFLTTAEFTKRASQAAAYGELVERGLIS